MDRIFFLSSSSHYLIRKLIVPGKSLIESRRICRISQDIVVCWPTPHPPIDSINVFHLTINVSIGAKGVDLKHDW